MYQIKLIIVTNTEKTEPVKMHKWFDHKIKLNVQAPLAKEKHKKIEHIHIHLNNACRFN